MPIFIYMPIYIYITRSPTAITNLLALEKLNSSIIFVTYHHAFVVAAIFEKAIFFKLLVAARIEAGFFFGFLCYESFEE